MKDETPPTSGASADLAKRLASAMAGLLPSCTRSASCFADQNHMRVRFIVDGPPSEDDQASVVAIDDHLFSSLDSEGGWDGSYAVETVRLDRVDDCRAFELPRIVHRREVRCESGPTPLPAGWKLTDAQEAFRAGRASLAWTADPGDELYRERLHAIAVEPASNRMLFSLADGRAVLASLKAAGQSPLLQLLSSTSEFLKVAQTR